MSSPRYSVEDYTRCLKGFDYVREKGSDELELGKIVLSSRSQIASQVFANLPVPNGLVFHEEGGSESKEYTFEPLLDLFPRNPRKGIRSLSEIKKDVDYGRMAHYEGMEENFRPITYNVIITGLQDAGKTFNLGRLATYFRGVIKEEKERIKYKQGLEEYLHKSEGDPEALAHLKSFGKSVGLEDPRNPLKVFASSTTIKEESMGEGAAQSDDVEQVTVYYDLGIVNFIILPGQSSFKRRTSEVFTRFEKKISKEGDLDVEEKVKNIDPLLEESDHNYVLLFSNLDRNGIFDRKASRPFLDYVIGSMSESFSDNAESGPFLDFVAEKSSEYESSDSSFVRLLREYKDWCRDYKRMKAEGEKTKKLQKKAEDMHERINNTGLYWFADLFREAVTWDLYSREHSNTKVMGITFTGVDLKEKVGEKIFEIYKQDSEKKKEEVEDWGDYCMSSFFKPSFEQISEMLDLFVDDVFKEDDHSTYFQLQPMSSYKQEYGGPLVFLMQLDKYFREDIQNNILDFGVNSLDFDDIQVWADKRFMIPVDKLKKVFDSQVEKGDLTLEKYQIAQLMQAYSHDELNLDLEKIVSVAQEYDVPEEYNEKIKGMKKLKKTFIEVVEAATVTARTGDLSSWSRIPKFYDNIKDSLDEDSLNEVEPVFEEYRNVVEEAKKRDIDLEVKKAQTGISEPPSPPPGLKAPKSPSAQKPQPPPGPPPGPSAKQKPQPPPGPPGGPPGSPSGGQPSSQSLRGAIMGELKALFKKRK